MTLRPLLACLLFAAAAAPVAAATYTIDPRHSQVRFKYSHLGFANIVGLLGGIEGELVYDPQTPDRAAVSVRIPIDSVQTGVAKLDEHLKSADFFDVAAHPFATFTSTGVEPAGEGRLKVSGDLVIHGETQPVVLDVTLNRMAPHPMSKAPTVGFDAATTLRRSAFGIERSAPAVSDEVQIEISIEAQQRAE